MPKRLYSDDLHRTIESMGRFALKPDWDRENATWLTKVSRGPNRWLEMKDKPEFYGREGFDYRVMDADSGKPVLMPCCDAAQNWLWYKVGETQHWYGDLDGKYWGCVVDEEVLAGARRDGLIREADYVSDMNSENDNLMRSGE